MVVEGCQGVGMPEMMQDREQFRLFLRLRGRSRRNRPEQRQGPGFQQLRRVVFAAAADEHAFGKIQGDGQRFNGPWAGVGPVPLEGDSVGLDPLAGRESQQQ